MKQKTVLIVEDDESLRRIIEHNLSEGGYSAAVSSSAEEARDVMKRQEVSLVITDIQLGGGASGMDLLAEIKRINKNVPVIVITAFGSISDAVQAMRMGAYDYITKPFSREQLGASVEKAFSYKYLLEENLRLHQELVSRFSFSSIIAGSSAMDNVLCHLARLAQTDAPVLILGESGTGKELAARALHYGGPRAKKRFVAVNSSAFSEHLLGSELFGHVKGSFTGALQDRAGKFEYADGGTLFMDEICDMHPGIQAKILRVLQEKEVTPVGSNKSVKVDVRLVTASNRDVYKEVTEGRFRDDLYYRINVVSIKIPPLRERRDDIPLLVQYFLQKFGASSVKIDKSIMDIFMKYSWPGNVRELENIIHRALALAGRKGTLTSSDLPEYVRYPSVSRRFVPDIPPEGISLEEMEKSFILKAMAAANNNKTKAAKLLGLTRSAIIYRMEKYGIGHISKIL